MEESESGERALKDRINEERGDYFAASLWSGPLGGATAVVAYAVIVSSAATPPGPLLWWGAAMFAATALQVGALVLPASARWVNSRGIPRLSTLAYVLLGSGWGATLWLDLDASRAADVRWITFAALFAISAGVVAGGVTFVSGLVFVPMWIGAITAFLKVGQPVAAIAAIVFAAICLRDMRRFGHMWTELITLRVESHTIAESHMWAATHDSMTSLVNRTGFLRAVEEAAEASDGETRVMFIDLDRFKEVNDNLGHAAGDAVLVETAERIKDALRSTDIVGRFGGDEFCVLLDPEHDDDSTDRLAHRIIEALEQPYQGAWGPERVEISASIGIASITAQDTTPERLLLDADFAMYEAKRQGRRRVVHFEADLKADVSSRRGLKADFRRLIREGALGADAQPIFDLKTASIHCVELMARWRLPGGGAVQPSVFIPLAAELGLTREVTKLMLRTAVEHLRTWTGHRELGAARVSVKVPASAIAGGMLVESVADVITEFGIEPGRLVIELTHTVDFAGSRSDLAQFRELRALGVDLAIADFGFGFDHATIDNLLSIPVQTVKLDATLIAKLGSDARQIAALRSIHDLAAVIGESVMVGGVETQAHLQLLHELRSDLAQGFYLCRPVHVQELASYIDGLKAEGWNPAATLLAHQID